MCFLDWLECFCLLCQKISAHVVTREWCKKLKPLKPVHSQWTKQMAKSQIKWEPDLADRYTGLEGGTVKTGPSAQMKEVTRTVTCLTSIVLFVMSFSFWKKLSKQYHVYAYEDSVAPVVAGDGKRPKMKQSCMSVEGSCHLADNKEHKFTFSALYVSV